jgi:parallel beta-helix repeat protein
LASEYPELNLPQNYMQAGTSTYQPPTLKSEPFYAVVFNEPVLALQVFSLSGLGLLGLVAVPPVKKRKQLRQALMLGIVVLCVFSVGYFVGLTVAQTGTITIEPNSFQTEASYVIFTDGTTVYAKNGTTGQIDFSGADASQIINWAFGNLTSGRTWKEKVIVKGNITITSKILLPSYSILEIQGTIVNGIGVSDMITNIDTTKGNVQIEIIGGEINGNAASGVQTYHPIEFTNVKDTIIRGVTIHDSYCCSIAIQGNSTGVKILNCNLTRWNYDCGIAIYGFSNGNVTDTVIDGNTILGTNSSSSTSKSGIDVSYAYGITITNNEVSYCNQTGIALESTAFSCVVSNNYVHHNQRYGIYVSGQHHTVMGNIVKYNGVGGNYPGIELYSTNYSIIIGNQAYDDLSSKLQDWGIYAEGSCNYDIVVDNDVSANRIGNLGPAPFPGSGNIVKNNYGFLTEYFSSASNATTTTWRFTPALGGLGVANLAPTAVFCSFNSTEVTGWTWSYVAPTLTITTATILTAPTTCYVYAIYTP